jgi:hypothetical protein
LKSPLVEAARSIPMSIVRTLQRTSGRSLTVELPADLADTDVEIVIQPAAKSVMPVPPEEDPRYAPFIQAKPPLTEEDRMLFERNPYPLRGAGSEFIDPFEPMVPPEDWDVYSEDAEVIPNDPA